MKDISAAERQKWAASRDPGEFFLHLWAHAAQWEPADRSVLPELPNTTLLELRQATLEDDGSAAVARLFGAMTRAWPRGRSHAIRMASASIVMAAMRAVDDAFLASHPRARTVSPSVGAPRPKPAWLDSAHIRRLRSGCFAVREEHRLIPNGPFARHARGRDAASADALSDWFAAVTAAPMHSRQQDRVVSINMKVIGTDIMRGVPGAPSLGRERIRFIPLAEDAADLTYSCTPRGTNTVLDVRPAVDTPGRLLSALVDGGGIDIAIAPELTIPGAAESEIAAGIMALAEHAPRIILAGSGLTDKKGPCGRSWNEARVLARGGKVLWRHRKMWPFGMQQAAALRYGLADPGDGAMLMEDIAGSSSVTVVDMDGFGRCVVLICQDLQSPPVVDEIVARYQPDWILVPVLDPGVNVPGWAHQRAVTLSHLGRTRTVVASSLSMSRLGTSGLATEPPIGLAVGPFAANPADGEPGRAVAIVRATAGRTPRSGLLVWDHAAPQWKTTDISAVP